MGKITNDYSKEIAHYLCTQLYGTLNPAYLKCEDLSHKKCDCQEIYLHIELNTYDGTLENYLHAKIFEFIEGGLCEQKTSVQEIPIMDGTIEQLDGLSIRK